MSEFMMIGGFALSAYGQYEQGRRAAIAGDLAKGSAYFEAEEYEKQGAEQASYLERQYERKQGQDIAATAAGNVDVSSGSTVMALVDQASRNAKNIATTIINSQHKAMALRMAGDQAKSLGVERGEAGNLGAASSLLMGGSKFAGMAGQSSKSDSGLGARDAESAGSDSNPFGDTV